MQLRRLASGVFACLALAQSSLGSVVAHCSATQTKSHTTMARHTHETSRTSGHAATSADQRGGDQDRDPGCHQMAQSDCSGMQSCGAAMDLPQRTPLALTQRDDLIVSRHLDSPLGLARAPEPPPPRA